MTLRKIRREELNRYARTLHFTIADDELDSYLRLTDAIGANFEALAQMRPPEPAAIDTRRRCGARPTPDEDPLNSVIRWCNVGGDRAGPLRGLRVAVKDNIEVAGVPCTNGSTMLDDYVPARDAIVVERLVEAGAEIVAKANMEAFAWSGNGDTSDYGPVRNPFDADRLAGGSSSGSAAAVFTPGIDVALGTDQGGSIRLPASWCGAIGLKPTFGMVPYVGISSLEPSYDHVGPITRTVRDAARLMQVIAGPHPEDPRQLGGSHPPDFLAAVDAAPATLTGVRIGVVAEGFVQEHDPDAPEGTHETHAAVRDAIVRLKELGADVTELSIPEIPLAGPVMFTTFAEGFTTTLKTGGNGFGHLGRVDERWSRALGKALRARGDDLTPIFKLVGIMGHYAHDQWHGALVARANAMRPVICAAVDRALQQVDVLLMPTTTHWANRYIPLAEQELSAAVLRGWSHVANTGVFDVTGHPSLSIPAAASGGLPVGVMLTGRHGADAELLALARTYEAAHGWLPVSPSA